MLQLKPDREAFDKVCKQLDSGELITCKHLIDIFGWPVIELLIILSSSAPNYEIINILTEIKEMIRE